MGGEGRGRGEGRRRVGEGGERGREGEGGGRKREGKEEAGEGTPRKNLTNPALVQTRIHLGLHTKQCSNT